MSAQGVSAPASPRPRESGLDTSNGLDFVQQRIGLFARIIGLISLAFLIVAVALGLTLEIGPSARPVAHVAGVTLLMAVWLLCQRGRYSLMTLEWLDAVALIGACTAWAFRPISSS